MSHVLAFIATAIIVIVVPGPDFAVVVRNAVTRGRMAGFFTGLGICNALMVHGTFAALGLSALLKTSATAFTVVKLIGAGYLAYLGARALLAARRSGISTEKTSALATPTTLRAAWRQGALTNLLNPKAALFFLSFLPQFIPSNGSFVGWTIGLVAILMALSFLWWTTVSITAAAVRSFLQREKVARTFDGVTGSVFVGLAAKLALTHR